MDALSTPHKLCEFVNGEWRAYRHQNCFEFERQGHESRMVIGSTNPINLLTELVDGLQAPLELTLALHSPRSDESPGRYESPELDHHSAEEFLGRYRGAFERDARCDLWIRSRTSELEIGLDKHDLLLVRGNYESVQAKLIARGFPQCEPKLPLPHSHHYGEEFDVDFMAMLEEFDWVLSPLLPGDGD